MNIFAEIINTRIFNFSIEALVNEIELLRSSNLSLNIEINQYEQQVLDFLDYQKSEPRLGINFSLIIALFI